MKLTNETGKLWRRMAAFFETGDLVPFFVLVSIVHYVKVLDGHDSAAVALAVGVAIDMLHFRTVRAWTNGRIWSVWLPIAALTTAMASLYHLRYYGNDWLLALPIPLGIAILAYQTAIHDKELSMIGRLKAAHGKAMSEVRRLQSDNDSLVTELDKRNQYLDKIKTERDKYRGECVRSKREIDELAQSAVTLSKLPPKFARIVTAVADGQPLNGELVTKHGISQSLIDRLGPVLKEK